MLISPSLAFCTASQLCVHQFPCFSLELFTLAKQKVVYVTTVFKSPEQTGYELCVPVPHAHKKEFDWLSLSQVTTSSSNYLCPDMEEEETCHDT